MRKILALLFLYSGMALAEDVSLIVYDGVYDSTTGQPPPVAGCSTPCGGTGSVTHRINALGYGYSGNFRRLSIYVDGVKETSVSVHNGGPPHPKQDPLFWDAQQDAAGPHTIVLVGTRSDGSTTSSAPLVITVIK